MRKKKKSRRIEEGQQYTFEVTGITELEDRGTCFVLKDPFGYKHLLTKEVYEDYHIEPGTSISCHVDKINCDGKVFIEPEHYYYKPGEIYSFDFLNFVNQVNEYGDKDLLAQVKDQFGNKTHVLLKLGSVSVLNPPSLIDCRLERIKKGRLFLSDPKIIRHISGIEIGKTYLFDVASIFRSADNEKYWLLLDPFDRKHLLPIPNYVNYNIDIGKKIICRVIKFSSKGFFLLEPQNPYYKEGEIYPFKVKRIEEAYLILHDIFDQEIKVACPDNLEKYSNRKSVNCIVTGFRKGRVVLDL